MTRLLSPYEAARELCVSEKQLRALTCAGHIRYINIGMGEKRETRRYDPADLKEFLENRKCQSTSVQGRQSTAMTSVIMGIDFQARRAARQSVKQRDLKRS